METVYFVTVVLLIGLAYFIYKRVKAPGVKGGGSNTSAPKRRHTDK